MKRRAEQVFGNDWGKYNGGNSGNFRAGAPLTQPIQNLGLVAPTRRFPNQTQLALPVAVSPGGKSKHLDFDLYRSSMRNEAPSVSVDNGTLNDEQRLVVESVLSGYSVRPIHVR